MRTFTLAIFCSLAAIVSCADNTPVASLQRTEAEWNQWPWNRSRADGSLTFSASVRSDTVPGQLVVSLVATPSGTSPVYFEYGYCSFGVRLYRTEALTSTPAWDNRPAFSPCPLALLWHNIPVNQPLTIRVGTIRPSTLSDSLPAGRYWAAIVVGGDTTRRLVPVGSVDIVRP